MPHMQHKPTKKIQEMIDELRSWLPNYNHGPADYPTLVWRILASMPYGDEAADMGYEGFNLGWQEIDQLGRMMTVIENRADVEDLIHGLMADEDEEQVDEARRRPRGVRDVDETPNVEWTRIPPGSRVELVGRPGSRSYVAILPNGSRANIYWGGNDAAAAQRALDRMAGVGRPGPTRRRGNTLARRRTR